MTQVRWALAGFGAGGRVFHAPMIAAAAGMELAAVVSTNPARADEARALGLDVVEDIPALVARGVEGVTITTPAGTHVALAHQALAAGLHVVVDKPFALTAAQARAVVTHAEEERRQLSVYQNRRWDGDYLTIAALLRDGRLGEVSRYESRVERFHPALPSWLTDLPSIEGGGTLVDLGPHLIDQAMQLFGRARTVFAELATFGRTSAAENDIRLSIVHEAGVHTTVVASLAAAAEGHRFLVNGDRGGITIDGFDVQEAQLFGGGTPRSLGPLWGREPDDRAGHLVVDGDASRIPLLAGRWTAFYPAMASAVRDGTPVPVDPNDAVHVCEIFDAARLSAAEGRVVTVSGGERSGVPG